MLHCFLHTLLPSQHRHLCFCYFPLPYFHCWFHSHIRGYFCCFFYGYGRYRWCSFQYCYCQMENVPLTRQLPCGCPFDVFPAADACCNPVWPITITLAPVDGDTPGEGNADPTTVTLDIPPQQAALPTNEGNILLVWPFQWLLNDCVDLCCCASHPI